MIFRLAARSFVRHIDRFAVVLLALSLGFAAIVLLLGVTGGMTQTLRTKAARYFGGDVMVFSFSADRTILDRAEVEKQFKALPSFEGLTKRTEYYGGDGTIYFAGSSVRQRKLIGIDWSVEGASFQQLDFVDGTAPMVSDARGILVSEATAARIGARTGDDVTVVFNTLGGQKNSLELVVRGIYRDTSFFGYASYVDFETLNAALGYPQGTVTTLGVHLLPGSDVDAEGDLFRSRLSKSVPTYPTIHNRDDQIQALNQAGAGARLGVMTLGANLAQIDDILYSLVTVAASATMVFLLIVIIGVGNTYRMIVFERTKELGTLRALGLGKIQLVTMVAAEAGWLGLTGALTGGLLGFCLLAGATIPQWSSNPLAGLFLQNGHLVPSVAFGPLTAAFVLLVGAALIGATGPAFRAARQRPVDALRSGE